MIKKILLLGNPALYEMSKEVKKEELDEIRQVIEDLHDTLLDFRNRMHSGRAIAAPQIGVPKRLIYMYIEKPFAFINPTIEFPDSEQMEVLDDCMSFPNLFVKVKRYKNCILRYKNENWEDCQWNLSGDLSELLQHEYDHLDGILAVMRGINNRSLVMKE